MSSFEEFDSNAVAQLTRSFILFMLRRTLFSTTGETIHLWCLPALKDIEKLESLTRVEPRCLSYMAPYVQYLGLKRRAAVALA